MLKRLFDTVAEAEMAAVVSGAPTGAWTRRVWFLCEWLTGRRLPLNDARTVEEDLPREIADLKSYDKARDAILARIDMADSRISLLIHVIRQNKGRLSRSKRDSQFPSLSDGEAATIEAIVQSAYGLSALHA